jgi:hypothetical protein
LRKSGRDAITAVGEKVAALMARGNRELGRAVSAQKLYESILG